MSVNGELERTRQAENTKKKREERVAEAVDAFWINHRRYYSLKFSKETSVITNYQQEMEKFYDAVSHAASEDTPVEIKEAFNAIKQDLSNILKRNLSEDDTRVTTTSNQNHTLESNEDNRSMSTLHTSKSTTESYVTREDLSSLAKIFSDSINLNRLPIPEPSMFHGDALLYNEWKISFDALIGSKDITPGEKIFYLKHYVKGSAREVLDGVTLFSSEEAYEDARRALDERYGNEFIVVEAYRDRIRDWPKIHSKDYLGLRRFSDFCKQLVMAMNSIHGLDILNDIRENRERILVKLPEWLINKWGVVLTDYQENKGRNPLFKEFSEFIARESKIKCNPITMNIGETITNMKKNTCMSTQSSTYASNTELTHTSHTPSTSQPMYQCMYCDRSGHDLHVCRKFADRTPQEKNDFIKKQGLCFGCLDKGHKSSNCKKRRQCKKCKKNHPSCLHGVYEALFPRSAIPSENRQQSNNHERQHADTSTMKTISNSRELHSRITKNSIRETPIRTEIYTMTIPVYVSSKHDPSNEILTYAMLDTQSNASFMLDELAHDLGAEIYDQRELTVETMTSTTAVTCKTYTNLQIRGIDSTHMISLPEILGRTKIPANTGSIATRDVAKQFPHLKEIHNKIPEPKDCKVGLLVGCDCPEALATTDSICTQAPFATRTNLGWVVVGATSTSADEMMSPAQVAQLLESDFSEEKQDKELSQNDMAFMRCVKTSIHKNNDGYYEMDLPFKDVPNMPNNKHLAVKRLSHLKHKFQKNDEYRREYTEFMTRIIDNGEAELADDDGGWFLPHHGIIHPKKKKLRVVFDASVRYKDKSLNEELLSGPDLTNSLIGVLIRFRRRRIAFVGDIEKMFHNFYVTNKDRDFLKFLWNPDDLDKPKAYRMCVHLFGATSSPGCANYGLKQIAQDNETEENKEACKYITNDFYMDDGLHSCDTVEEAMKIIHDARDICSNGNLRLHKFISNNNEVLETLPNSEVAETRELDLNKGNEQRVLGIKWLTQSDELVFSHLPQKTPTRRGILSAVSSIFDPLGLIAPVTLRGKLILQELCVLNIGWDEQLELSEHTIYQKWIAWSNEMNQIGSIKINRCNQPDDFGRVIAEELHYFSDASSRGYGVCAYIRSVNERGETHCSLAIAKARVAPRKTQTIPRLELMAAVTAVRISKLLRAELNKEDIKEFFHTDSEIVLNYINNDAKRFHVFVSNRVQEIRNHTDPTQWHYVKGLSNPADHASRGLTVAQLTHSNWLCGPTFLNVTDTQLTPYSSKKLLPEDPEVRKIFIHTIDVKRQDLLRRMEIFSSWSKAVHAINVLRRCVLLRKGATLPSLAEQLHNTEMFIIRTCQMHHFSNEYNILRESTHRQSGTLYKLSAFIDKADIIRVGGRLEQSRLAYNVKHPVILPKNCHVTQLIMNHCHQKVFHQGRGITINEIISRGYWIIGCSRLVASMIHSCVTCRKIRGDFMTQKMADLPNERVDCSAPFTYVGLDCFGPFIVHERRSNMKKYGVILSCLSSRAIHIEVLDDLSTDTFISGLRCFFAIRGTPRVIKCDRGTNFVGASREFKQSFKDVNSETLKRTLAAQSCEFMFNSPYASHMAGSWERHIRTIRNILNGILAQHGNRLDTSTLRTFMYEAMAIINNRPLCKLNSETLDPLTPNHILMMKPRTMMPPPGQFEREDIYSRKRWRRVQQLAEEFWRRWHPEYVSTLQIRQKWSKPRRNANVDDVVIIKDECMPRGQWRLGQVKQILPSKDTLVRRVRIEVMNQENSKKILIERPIHKIVLLIPVERL